MPRANPIYLLKRAELAVRGCVERALRNFDLTPNQFFILVLVDNGEATSSAELARAMGVLPQSMSDLIAPLVQRGVIVREPDPGNRRILRARLTATGQKLYERATEAGQGIEQALFRDFTDADLAALTHSLERLLATAEAQDTQPISRRRTSGGG